MQIFGDEKIKLEIFWKAPYVYGEDWQTSRVDLSMGESDYEIYAPVNQELSSKKEQCLNFVLFNKKNNQQKQLSKIEIPIYLIKSMQISVRVFQSYKDQNAKRQGELPVYLDPFYDFEANETYQIRIVHRDNSLKALIDKKIFEATRKKKLRDIQIMKLINEKDNIPTPISKSFDKAFKEFKKMLNALTADNYELDQLSKEQLTLRFKDAQEKLEDIKINVNISQKISPLKDPAHIQKISLELISVTRALNKKGVFF